MRKDYSFKSARSASCFGFGPPGVAVGFEEPSLTSGPASVSRP